MHVSKNYISSFKKVYRVILDRLCNDKGNIIFIDITLDTAIPVFVDILFNLFLKKNQHQSGILFKPQLFFSILIFDIRVYEGYLKAAFGLR